MEDTSIDNEEADKPRTDSSSKTSLPPEFPLTLDKRSLRKNPCLQAVFKNDLSLLMSCVQNGHSVNEPCTTTKPYITCMTLASLNNNIEMVKYLVSLSKNRISLHHPMLLYGNPLCHAASHGNADMVTVLLKHDCNLNMQLDQEWTPLFYAVNKQNVQIVQLLLDAGSNVNILDDQYRTPIYYAIEHNNSRGISILELLLPLCDDINTVDHTGLTPLFLAAYNDNISAVTLLLKYGAFLTHNHQGSAPLLYAYSKRNMLLIKTMLKYHKYKISNNDLITKLCISNDVETLKMICNIGSVTSNCMIQYNNKPLVKAIQCSCNNSPGICESIRLLLDHGIKLNTPPMDEETNPFYLATTKRKFALVKVLLDYGIDVHSFTYNEKIDMELFNYPHDVQELNTLIWSNGYRFVAYKHSSGIKTLKDICSKSQIDESLALVNKLRKLPLPLLLIARNYVRSFLYNINVDRGVMPLPQAVKHLNVPINLKVLICDPGCSSVYLC